MSPHCVLCFYTQKQTTIVTIILLNLFIVHSFLNDFQIGSFFGSLIFIPLFTGFVDTVKQYVEYIAIDSHSESQQGKT